MDQGNNETNIIEEEHQGDLSNWTEFFCGDSPSRFTMQLSQVKFIMWIHFLIISIIYKYKTLKQILKLFFLT